GLKACVSRVAARKRRYLSTITATEKMDSAARQQITPAPNMPTVFSSSVKGMASSYAPQPRPRTPFLLVDSSAGALRLQPDFVVIRPHSFRLCQYQSDYNR